MDPAPDGWLDIERVYCFDWDSFGTEDMNRLRSVFEALPGSRKHDPDDCHWWFADHADTEGGYLTAGIEPPGLQVFGTLPIEKWIAWEGEFRRSVDCFPVCSVG